MNNLSTQIATTREHSERLLAMGIRSETADMHYSEMPTIAAMTDEVCNGINNDETESVLFSDRGRLSDTPAWSLSRLISMMPKCIICNSLEYGFALYSCHDDKTFSMQYIRDNGYEGIDTLVFKDNENLFECCVSMIDWLIKNNHFNKEYLK